MAGGSASTHVTDSSAASSRLQPYRANTSDLLAGGTSALTGAQFAAFDSMYKAYQGAYAQGAGSAALYAPQSMRYDSLRRFVLPIAIISICLIFKPTSTKPQAGKLG